MFQSKFKTIVKKSLQPELTVINNMLKRVWRNKKINLRIAVKTFEAKGIILSSILE